jgi:hypothetical protein
VARFHLVHWIPHKRMHGLNGYKEVIDTIQWGLEQLGHNVTYGLNNIISGATNIIFGAQTMDTATIAALPSNTIIYNLEQLRNIPVNAIRDEIKYIASSQELEIWDYRKENLQTWNALGRENIKVVPVGYAPILSRISKAVYQDIDVLIYGLSGERRLQVFHILSQSGLSTLFVSGLYGSARDNLISRSKIVLNINLYPQSKIFEIVRVSYLLANKKAIVSDYEPDADLDSDMISAVRFTKTPKELLDVCFMLAENDAERMKLEEQGFASISKRDIRNALKSVLLM